ncbi:MAG: MBL fold metallo-hydrolase [Promethearchaeota archaeon]|nr:MAG: MBL fold metallo-hydrolase [Candidatus Lokiarchaeota archaeon]
MFSASKRRDSMQVIDGVIFIPGVGFNSNIYIVGKNEIGIIDTGASASYVSHVLDAMKQFNLDPQKVKKLILTHIHPDHTGGIGGFIQAFNPRIYMHTDDAIAFTQKFADRMELLIGGEAIPIDQFTFQVIHTPGHSPGGICLYDPEKKILFSGDTIFSHGNVGRTDLHGGNSRLLIESIEKLLRLDIEYLCPGHMNAVKNGNDHVRESYNFAKMVF